MMCIQLIIINMTSFIYPSRYAVCATEHVRVLGSVPMGSSVIYVFTYAYLFLRIHAMCVYVCVRR